MKTLIINENTNIPKLSHITKQIKDFYPNLQFRPGQLPAIQIIIDKFQTYDNVFLAAPCGIGKSWIAIITSNILSKYTHTNLYPNFPSPPYCLLTPLLNLMKQYSRDFPHLTIVKGRQNFKCCTNNLTCDKGECQTHHKFKCTNLCPYEQQKQRADQSPYILSNPSFILRLSQSPKFKPRLLTIYDEAHLLPSILSNLIQIKITDRNWLDFGKKNYPIPLYSRPKDWLPIIHLMKSNAKDVLSTLDEDDLTESEAIIYKKTTHFLVKATTLIKHIESHPSIFKIKDTSFIPIDSSPFAKHYLDSVSPKRLFMSATILNPDYLSSQLGLDNCLFIKFNFSPFPLRNRKIYIHDLPSLSYKSYAKNLPTYLSKIESILKSHKDQKTVIVTPSYKLTTDISNYLSPNFKITTHTKNSPNKNTIIQTFKDSKSPNILISPIIGTGISFDDDFARCLIIPKLFYQNLSDDITKAIMIYEQKKYIKSNECGLYNPIDGLCHSWRCNQQCTPSYQYNAALSLIQATGRTVRNKNDWCKVHILDKSFNQFLRKNRHLFPKYWLDSITYLKK